MRVLLDRPATLPIAGALLAVAHLLALASGVSSASPSAGLLLGLALALAGLLPALAPTLAAAGILLGGAVPVGGLPLDGVVVGAVVLWSTARRLGPWTRSLALVGALLLCGLGGVVLSASLRPSLDSPEPPQNIRFLVLVAVALLAAAVLAAIAVLSFVRGLRNPVGPEDRIERLLERVAGPQDAFAAGSAGAQALVLLAISVVPYSVGEDSLHPFVAGVLAVALVLHRRSPGLALGVAWVGAALQMGVRLEPAPSDLAILVVLFGAGAADSKRVRTAGAVSAVVGTVVAVAYLSIAFGLAQDSPSSLITVGASSGGILATLGLSWTIGLLSRAARRARVGQSERDEAERERARAQRELDTVEERNRIARDMHDVVAHSLAVVIAQADGARYLGSASPEQTDAALLTISGVARDALGDVRQLLAQLRHSQMDGPQPEARDLPSLLESVSGTGAPVRSELGLDLESVPRATGLALYRITQEATTNALRHGRPGAPLDIALRREGGDVVLTVRNARCEDALDTPGEGHGLIGMRERAVLAGGTLLAGPDGDDFVVDARLPAPPVPPRTSPVTLVPPLASGGIPS